MSLGRLVVRSGIHPDESLPGLLTRLSEYNGLDSPVRILGHVGLTPGFEKSHADLAELAKFIGVRGSSLKAASFAPVNAGATVLSFGGMRVNRNHLNTLGDRVCPLCIEEGSYSRRLWHLRAYAVCHSHGIRADGRLQQMRPTPVVASPDHGALHLRRTFAFRTSSNFPGVAIGVDACGCGERIVSTSFGERAARGNLRSSLVLRCRQSG